MARRILTWLQTLEAQKRAAGFTKCEPIRLTPGQYDELERELEGNRADMSIVTCQGVHKIEKIDHHIRATGDNVIMCPREDLFQEVDKAAGVELVSFGNSVTSVPDNIACVEIVSVGGLVQGLKAGDIVFIDFYRVKQGYICANEELYIAGSDAFAAKFDVLSGEILPLDNFVVTKEAKARFNVGLTGQDRITAPDITLTDGFTSGKTSKGSAAAKTVYHEVVSVGKITETPRGVMTKAERELLDAILEGDRLRECYSLIEQIREERGAGIMPDIVKGDLVGFMKELGTKVRVRGEYRWIVPYANVLAEVMDEDLLRSSILSGQSGVICQKVA